MIKFKNVILIFVRSLYGQPFEKPSQDIDCLKQSKEMNKILSQKLLKKLHSVCLFFMTKKNYQFLNNYG